MNTLPQTTAVIEAGIAEGLHFGAQMAVTFRGENIADTAIGFNAPFEVLETDHLMLWLSACKPIAAVAIGLLMERDQIDLDQPVAHWIPDFASKRKQHITPRHLLTHTAGIRGGTLGWTPRPWEEAIGILCATKPEPHWEPGKQAGYHVDSAWYMLAELIRVIDGRHFREFVREDVFLPLEMPKCWVGIPEPDFDRLEDRIAWIYNTAGDTPEIQEALCQPASVIHCRPAGNGRGPANEFLRFYNAMHAMIRGADGLLRSETARDLVAPHRVGMFDRTFRQTMDWGLGFMRQSDHYAPGDVPYQFGSHASNDAFGHCGNQSTAAFCDPTHELCVVVLTNGMPGEEKHQPRMRLILDTLYQELDLA